MDYLAGATPIAWQAFSRESLDREHTLGRDVLVSFMARWDPATWIQHHLIDEPDVRRLLRQRNVVALEADWTNTDPEIGKELEALGERSIPLLVIYPASGNPIVLYFDDPGHAQLIKALKGL